MEKVPNRDPNAARKNAAAKKEEDIIRGIIEEV
jgi:hypothetical protein